MVEQQKSGNVMGKRESGLDETKELGELSLMGKEIKDKNSREGI